MAKFKMVVLPVKFNNPEIIDKTVTAENLIEYWKTNNYFKNIQKENNVIANLKYISERDQMMQI